MTNKTIGIIDHVGRKAGIDYYSTELAEGFVENDCEVIICSNYHHAGSDSIKTFKYFPFFIQNKVIQFVALMVAFIRSSIKCKNAKVDYVLIHLFSAQLFFTLFIIVVKLFGLKIVIISHDVESFAKDEKTFTKKLIYNTLASHIVVHNTYSRTCLDKYCSKPEKISIIQQGGYINLVDANISKEDSRKELGIDQKQKIILFFGQIKKVKRLDVLLKAIAHVKGDFKVIVAGKVWKDSFETYEKIIQEQQIQENLILNIRYINDDEREKYMKCADIMVLPYEEIYQSAVLLMGMSYNLAMVTSDAEAFKEVIVDGKNGLIFKSGDYIELSEKLSTLIHKEDYCREISRNGLQTIENDFAWKNISKQYINKISFSL